MPSIPPELQDLLGPILGELIESRSKPLRHARAITTLPGTSGRRGTYFLEFGDGSVLKGRLVPNTWEAEAIVRINAQLDHRHFTEVLARHDRALLERWVEGVAPEGQVEEGLLDHCARLLAGIHELPCAEPLDGHELIAARLGELEMEVDRLTELGALRASTVAALWAGANASVPVRVEVGAIHHDFCGENLVVAPNGDPVNIDNGSLRFGALEEDLARTWYRWPTASAHWNAFANAYWTTRGRSGGPELSPFWCIAVTMRSLSDRLRAGGRRMRFPLAVLERLAETGGRPTSLSDLTPYDQDP